ncbi:hypothetical protein NCAS_0D01540 [Naumovozyma castellii]|uniref:Maintenance of telomere capping protein 6 n=1 Tax=Naumovozyma castellii TaxID=27288 RepID=G0VDU6_NAUCA|nr:hypothetical protein NCAS_0D01540 [Naumovozyma castellii CBS 4309]CCC69735.1 hypothetical protein NCAS_0D01540 [Naumovozyma castellii CBS 4309]
MPMQRALLKAYLWVLLIITFLPNCHAIDSWAQPSGQRRTAIRSQRDMLANVTIDEIPIVGVDLRHVLFSDNFTSSSNLNTNQTNTIYMNNLSDLLTAGVQGLVLDIEPNHGFWVVTNTTLLLSTFLDTLESFLLSTNDNLSADIIMLFLRPPVNLTLNSTVYHTHPQLNLTYILDQHLGSSRIYSPSILAADRAMGDAWDAFGESKTDGWPTLGTFLYTRKKRVLITDLSSKSNSTIDSPYIFPNTITHYSSGNMTSDCPNTLSALSYMSTVSFQFLEAVFNEDDISEYVSCGVSPIISNTYNVNSLSNIKTLLDKTVVWSWGEDEPTISNTKITIVKDTLEALNCAQLSFSSGTDSMTWQVANCYDNKRGLCRYKDHKYVWKLTKDDDNTYFSFDGRGDSKCPDDYVFAIPRTPLEEKAVLLYFRQQNITDIDAWIDLNSISVSNCWVTGGPYASCPYQKVVSRRNFVTMLLPVVICSFAILCIVLYLSILRTPIHDNRKNWRRIVNKISKAEFEGVPS